MNLIGPAPFTGTEYDCLLDAFDFRGSAHALFDSLVGFQVDLVIAFDEKILVKLEPDIIAIHHQYKVLIMLRP